MSSEVAIRADHLCKTFPRFGHPLERLKNLLLRHTAPSPDDFVALKDLSFELRKGEVLGIVGCNGAGKSTLLQLICGTLNPSSGHLEVKGRISALLELGAGFNPEFTGRENVYLSGAVMGLTGAQIDARFDSIVEFSGISAFIDQPVKTYSSGMYVRLAFSVATSIDPDILVIDEALSVGDGDFARRSFDRIMGLKEQGATVLFCSHSLYQVEAICQNAIWLDRGMLQAAGPATDVVRRYGEYLESLKTKSTTAVPVSLDDRGLKSIRLIKAELECNSQRGNRITIDSGKDDVTLWVEFTVAVDLPAPTVAYEIRTRSGISVNSAASFHDNFAFRDDGDNTQLRRVAVTFPRLPLMPGEYSLSIYLGCERALHVYDSADAALWIDVRGRAPSPGLVQLNHHWHQETATDPIP